MADVLPPTFMHILLCFTSFLAVTLCVNTPPCRTASSVKSAREAEEPIQSTVESESSEIGECCSICRSVPIQETVNSISYLHDILENTQDSPDETVKTRCGHKFCRNCIKGWVSRDKNNCPLCRTNLASFWDFKARFGLDLSAPMQNNPPAAIPTCLNLIALIMEILIFSTFLEEMAHEGIPVLNVTVASPILRCSNLVTTFQMMASGICLTTTSLIVLMLIYFMVECGIGVFSSGFSVEALLSRFCRRIINSPFGLFLDMLNTSTICMIYLLAASMSLLEPHGYETRSLSLFLKDQALPGLFWLFLFFSDFQVGLGTFGDLLLKIPLILLALAIAYLALLNLSHQMQTSVPNNMSAFFSIGIILNLARRFIFPIHYGSVHPFFRAVFNKRYILWLTVAAQSVFYITYHEKDLLKMVDNLVETVYTDGANLTATINEVTKNFSSLTISELWAYV